MPRFFIDLRDSHGLIKDEEGAIFRHIEDALDEAKASARDLARQYDHPVHPAFKNDCTDEASPGHR